MIVFKKNQIVTIAMVCLLIVAGYLNFIYSDKSYSNDDTTPVSEIVNEDEVENYGEAQFVNASGDAKADYFNETKLNKEKARSEALALIKEVAESENSTEAAKQTAQASMLAMAGNIEKEGNIENILMSKGFSKVSVYINDNSVTVSVLTEGLDASDVAKIRDVVIDETSVSADKIKIVEIK